MGCVQVYKTLRQRQRWLCYLHIRDLSDRSCKTSKIHRQYPRNNAELNVMRTNLWMRLNFVGQIHVFRDEICLLNYWWAEECESNGSRCWSIISTGKAKTYTEKNAIRNVLQKQICESVETEETVTSPRWQWSPTV